MTRVVCELDHCIKNINGMCQEDEITIYAVEDEATCYDANLMYRKKEKK